MSEDWTEAGPPAPAIRKDVILRRYSCGGDPGPDEGDAPTAASDPADADRADADRAGARDRDLAELGDYVRLLADRMGLEDWTFDVGYIDDEGRYSHPTCYVEVEDIPSKSATVYAHADFFDETPEARRTIVVKDLVYCHLAGLYADDRVYEVEDLGKELFAAIASIAAAWAPCLPLPLVGWMRRAEAKS